ncbi:hypothetical protein [Streptomyces sp. NPDC090022]|uniref:hypothetical protein n=1 Tax=Streptomyces sp. NPDC090022 TaxID=3365920 RepID=UPI0038254E9E
MFFDSQFTTIDRVGGTFNNMSLRGLHDGTRNQAFCLGGNQEQAYAQLCNGSASQKWARVTRG